MRLVLDTNQAKSICQHRPPHGIHPTIVIPAMTWAEIILSPPQHSQARLQAIAEYELRFGMDTRYMYARLSELREDQIRDFDPVFPQDSWEHQVHLLAFKNPNDDHRSRAQERHENARRSTIEIEERIAARRKKGKVIPLSSLSELDNLYIFGPAAAFRSATFEDLAFTGSTSIRATSEDAFYDAFVSNAALLRYLRLQATVYLGYENGWTDLALNVSASPNRNDFPDVMLPLYAKDGDIILTDDKKWRRAFRHVDPEERVTISTWKEWIKSNATRDGGRM